MAAWNARTEAAQCLMEILEQGGYASIVIDRRIQKYPPSVDFRDKALVTHLVYTTLSHLRLIDALIDRYSKTPVRRMKPFIAAAMRIAAAQMLFDDRIPDRAAVHEAVESVKHSPLKGLSGFVNGVLRAIERGDRAVPLPEQPLLAAALSCSLPDALVLNWAEDYGEEEALRLAKDLSEEPCLSVRCNTLMTTPEALYEELKDWLGEEQVRRCRTADWVFYLDRAPSLETVPALKEGRMAVQNESSVLAALATLSQPGMQVLDMCAAPGGKSGCMAQMMENRGHIISCDIHEHKIRLMDKRNREMGYTCIQTRLQDGTQFVPEWEQAFDRVLLDAPCSGYGILRSKPDIRWKRTEEEEKGLPELQWKLLTNAARYVRPGGRLVYSTCTLRAAENEWQVRRFLDTFTDFTEADLEKDLPRTTLCDTIKGDRAAVPASSTGWKTIRPETRGRDGFFIAAMVRKE